MMFFSTKSKERLKQYSSRHPYTHGIQSNIRPQRFSIKPNSVEEKNRFTQ